MTLTEQRRQDRAVRNNYILESLGWRVLSSADSQIAVAVTRGSKSFNFTFQIDRLDYKLGLLLGGQAWLELVALDGASDAGEVPLHDVVLAITLTAHELKFA